MNDLWHLPPALPPLSPAQRAFVGAAESRGATAPASACLLAELPRISTSDLDALVDQGLVREAADWRYYVFRPRRGHGGAAPAVTLPPSVTAQLRRGRVVRTAMFWLVLLGIPVILFFLQPFGGQ